ncbi:transcriptional repressor AgaR [Thorsellia kenyensis]|uniref:Transcriptional repressor AgaR n=1 Tax=Thorsellia kenyensis TaxID=1549888 RepID=A0ABV6CD41_9GAMM
MMTCSERRRFILEQLCESGSVKVEKLSKHFNVSTVTIRNDLRSLEQQGCAICFYGGAKLNQQFAFERTLNDKDAINKQLKKRIANKASTLINDGDKIILDSGSTVSQIVPFIQNKSLIILTNALNIAFELSQFENIELLVTGGHLSHKSWSLYGSLSEDLLQQYRFDKLFLGVDGFDIKNGLTTPNLMEAQLNKLMCRVANEIIVVTDSSKFNRTSFCNISDLNQVNKVITDEKIPDLYHAMLLDSGIEVLIV